MSHDEAKKINKCVFSWTSYLSHTKKGAALTIETSYRVVTTEMTLAVLLESSQKGDLWDSLVKGPDPDWMTLSPTTFISAQETE